MNALFHGLDFSRLRAEPQGFGFGGFAGALAVIMTGFLLQWPTLVTLAMYPILVIMYALLGRREEAEMIAQFGDAYRRYRAAVPAFLPRLTHARRSRA